MYKGFAKYYDALMENTPYEIWAFYLDGYISSRYGKGVDVLDLACGTGNITIRLAKLGYNMTGVDMSEYMLNQAKNKAESEAIKIDFISQDMRLLNLPNTFDTVVSVCDGMNYVLQEDELKQVFIRVKQILKPHGAFLFDMNTEYKFKHQLGNNTFKGSGTGGKAYEWENTYNEETKINEYRVTFFSLNNDERFVETHKQKAYDPLTVKKLLTEASFNQIKIRNSYTGTDMDEKTTRALFIAEL